MDGAIAVVAIVVTDQARSLEFFTQKVGLEKRTDITPPGGSRWVTVGLKGQELELSLWEVGSAADPAQRTASRHWAPAKAPPIVLRVADCTHAYQELRSRGVEFVQPLAEYPWGTVATFEDPDRNLFTISQPRSASPK